MDNIVGLVLTLGVGLFILVGTLIVFFTRTNERIMDFFISMAFGVMVVLVLVELIPEAFELMESGSIVLIFSIIGVMILKLLDLFVPHHEHNHSDKHGELENLEHIGLVSSVALVLHNIIEGMALYGTTLTSINVGLMLCLGIGLHNIPMGLVISSTFYQANKSIKKTILISIGISLSTFIGGLLMFILGDNYINDFILGSSICLTLGMIVYIALFELLPRMICSKNKKIVICGTLMGTVILFISSLF